MKETMQYGAEATFNLFISFSIFSFSFTLCSILSLYPLHVLSHSRFFLLLHSGFLAHTDTHKHTQNSRILAFLLSPALAFSLCFALAYVLGLLSCPLI